MNHSTIEYLNISYAFLGGKFYLLPEINIMSVALVIVNKYGDYFQMVHPDLNLLPQSTGDTTTNTIYPLPY